MRTQELFFHDITSVEELREKANLFSKLFNGNILVFVRGKFINVKTGDVAFFDMAWHKVEKIGYKYISILDNFESKPAEEYKLDDWAGPKFDVWLKEG